MSRPGRKRRVLIVTNGFPPTMLADMQRARMLAYDLLQAGWEAEILAPAVYWSLRPSAPSTTPPGAHGGK